MEQLFAQMKETEALLRARKAQVSRLVLAGAETATAEMAAIHKLELQLANLRAMQQANELAMAADEG
jgi:hypothetical protein